MSDDVISATPDKYKKLLVTMHHASRDLTNRGRVQRSRKLASSTYVRIAAFSAGQLAV